MPSNNSKHQNCLHSNKSIITCAKKNHTSLMQAVIPQIFTYFILVSESKPSKLTKSLTFPHPRIAKS